MPRLFISYSRDNEIFALQLAHALSDAGADVWIDLDDIPVADSRRSEFKDGLERSDILLVIISAASMASKNVVQEWQYALDNDRPIVPILYQPATIPTQLKRLKAIDFYNNPYDIALLLLFQKLSSLGIKGLSLSSSLPSSAKNANALQPNEQPLPASNVQHRQRTIKLTLPILGVILMMVIGTIVIIAILMMRDNGDGDVNTPAIAIEASEIAATEETVTETLTPTDEPTAIETPEPTATETPEPTATETPEPTATETPEPTATETPEPTATETPEPTATETPEPTATETPEPTATETPEPTATETPTITVEPSAIPTTANTNFVGRWETTNPNSVVTVVEIAQDDAMLVVTMLRDCGSDLCEWGTASTLVTDADDNRLILTLDEGFVVRTQVITLRDTGKIILTTNSEYANGRNPQRTSNTYTRTSD